MYRRGYSVIQLFESGCMYTHESTDFISVSLSLMHALLTSLHGLLLQHILCSIERRILTAISILDVDSKHLIFVFFWLAILSPATPYALS
jgi:hypothetical protein